MEKKDPIIQATEPMRMETKAGKYFWCACGRSKKPPFCDGSHKDTGIRPVRVIIEEDKEVAWCMCKQTKNPPFCDGAHRKLDK